MNRCSASYVIRKLQIKTIVTYPYTPIRMAQIQTTDAPNGGEDMEQLGLSFTAGGIHKWYSHFVRQFGSFLIQWWIHVIIHLSKPTRCMLPKANPSVDVDSRRPDMSV